MYPPPTKENIAALRDVQARVISSSSENSPMGIVSLNSSIISLLSMLLCSALGIEMDDSVVIVVVVLIILFVVASSGRSGTE